MNITNTRRKRSPIWLMPLDKFKQIVTNNTSISGILRDCGIPIKGCNYRTIKARVQAENIDISHIKLGLGFNKGRKFKSNPISLDKVMIKGSTYSRKHLKRRLLTNGILKNECSICNLGNEWNGKPIVMRLDHINGDSTDHRKENLRMVCPNCDSQLLTYCGKKIK